MSGTANGTTPAYLGERPEARMDREKGATLVPHDGFADETSSMSSTETQAGVKRLEAVTTSWTKWSLAIAYVGYASYHPLVNDPHTKSCIDYSQFCPFCFLRYASLLNVSDSSVQSLPHGLLDLS